MSDIRFDGRVAVITGAGGGLGKTYALDLASRGASIVVNDLGGAADGTGGGSSMADATVKEINEAGGKAVANYDSVATPEGGKAIIQAALDNFGKVDVLINNAGILRDGMSFKMDEADWDAVVNVHLKGHFCCARFASAYWRAKAKETGDPLGATLVNTASESGLYGNAGQINYAAAKAGIASMTIVEAREYERFGVRVNALAPVARTRLTEALAGEYMQPDASGFDRFAPENVAAVAAWLASDLSAPMSGQVVKVQGGVVQLLEGWRPTTEANVDDPWSIDLVDDVRAELLGASDGSIPPFFFDSPS
jgi:NAD(P)-dependent dehydrogenase (short-subunit alcohol dehydrogenase family)